MNKKRIFAIILAGVLVTACVSCSNNSEKNTDKDQALSAETIENAPEKSHFTMMEREYPVTFKAQDEDVIYVTGNLRKASMVAFDRANSAISKNMSSALASAHDRNTENADVLMQDVMAALTTADFDKQNAGFPWRISSDYELMRNDGLVVCVKETIEYFAGDNNHNVYTFYYNFDAKTGEQITQVMYDEGDDDARDAADSLLYDKLTAKYGEIINYDMVTSSIVEATVDGWYFTDSGIVVHFNRDTIAPYEEGEFEVEFTKDELFETAKQYFLS